LFPEVGLPRVPSIDRDAARMASKRMPEPPQGLFGHDDAFSPLENVAPIDCLRFISFGSGSSGNCAYIGDGDSGFLIDAGVDCHKVELELKRNGIEMKSVKGIVLTHDHSDHVHYAYSLVRANRHMRVYCTPKALNGILRRHNISNRIKDYHAPIYKEHPFRIGNFTVLAFEVMHDGTDNAGFFITHGQHSLTVATDLGCISERVDYYMRQANYIMIEANYDNDMLSAGSYPEYLKARIRSGNGHLDNRDTAAYLAEIYSEKLRHIFLCHLSKDNNTPETALRTIESALLSTGIKAVGDGSGTPYARMAPVQLMALPRFESTGLITLRLT
nr:MBL fold metallo-hydrolase [Muribaculaceae bacterium]